MRTRPAEFILNLPEGVRVVNWKSPVASGPPGPIASRLPGESQNRTPSVTGTENIMARPSKTSFALLGLIFCLGPLQAAGQTIPSSYSFFETRQEAGAFFGVTNQGTGRFGYGPKPGSTFGARYAVNLAGPFALEGTFSYLPTTRDIVDPSRDEGDRVVGDTDAKILKGDARIRFSLTGDRTWKGFHPYFLVGAGLGWDVAAESDQGRTASSG